MRATLSISLSLAVALGACTELPAPDPSTPLAAFERTDRATARLEFQRKTDAQKVTLWREHFERETAATPFTAAQAAILAEAVADLPRLVRGFDAALAARAEAAFSEVELARLFELPGRWAADEMNEVHQGRAGLVAEGCDARWCVCGLPPQPAGLVCDGANCSATSSGCGWFGQQSCTRECYIAE